MYAVTSTPLLSFTRATLRRAEFGFFGVVVYTRVHTPRCWGLAFSAGALVFVTLGARPLRTNCWIVGTNCSLVSYCSAAHRTGTMRSGSSGQPAIRDGTHIAGGVAVGAAFDRRSNAFRPASPEIGECALGTHPGNVSRRAWDGQPDRRPDGGVEGRPERASEDSTGDGRQEFRQSVDQRVELPA